MPLAEARILPPSRLARHEHAAVHAAALHWNRRKIGSCGLERRLASAVDPPECPLDDVRIRSPAGTTILRCVPDRIALPGGCRSPGCRYIPAHGFRSHRRAAGVSGDGAGVCARGMADRRRRGGTSARNSRSRRYGGRRHWVLPGFMSARSLAAAGSAGSMRRSSSRNWPRPARRRRPICRSTTWRHG